MGKATTKKLLVFGASFLIGALVIGLVFPFAYGLYQGLSGAFGNDVRHHFDQQMMVRNELYFIIPVALLSTLLGLTGFALLILGLFGHLRYRN